MKSFPPCAHIKICAQSAWLQSPGFLYFITMTVSLAIVIYPLNASSFTRVLGIYLPTAVSEVSCDSTFYKGLWVVLLLPKHTKFPKENVQIAVLQLAHC